MANKFKKVSKAQSKKQEDDKILRTAMGLGLIAIVIIVVFIVYGSNKQNTGTSQTAPQQTSSQNTSQLQQKVQSDEKTAQANPKDYTAQKTLGNSYYDLGFAYLQAKNAQDSTTNFSKAVETYQKALAMNFDINVQTDMATAAFYGNQPDIADAAFKKAIEKEPEFYTARINYGIFLRDAKGDKAGAKAQFEYVANQNKDTNNKGQAQDLLKTLN